MAWVQDVDYVVERQENHWTVCFEETPCGRFESRRAALGSAVQDAERVQRLGHRVRVFVRRADGRLRHLPGTPRIRPPDDAATSPSPRRREALSRR